MPDVLTDTLTVPAAAARRRSIRAFDPRPIPAEELDAILDVVRLAPSAFNVQPWRFVVVRSPEVKARLAGAAYNQRQVTAAPAVLVLYTDTADALATVDEVIHPGLTGEQREKARAGILAAFAGRSAEAVEDWGAAQGHIALGYLLLAARRTATRRRRWRGSTPRP
jgi:nitroreductase